MSIFLEIIEITGFVFLIPAVLGWVYFMVELLSSMLVNDPNPDAGLPALGCLAYIVLYGLVIITKDIRKQRG